MSRLIVVLFRSFYGTFHLGRYADGFTRARVRNRVRNRVRFTDNVGVRNTVGMRDTVEVKARARIRFMNIVPV